MKSIHLIQRVLLILLVLFSSSLVLAKSKGGMEFEKFLKVADMDAIKVDFREKKESIRLIGIDAPESKPNNKAIGVWGYERVK
jgi:micrococcal nuclease